MKKFFCPLALAMALFSLTGCGLKGPLYFPPADGKAKPATQSTAPQPALPSTSQDRNNRGTDNVPTQVVY